MIADDVSVVDRLLLGLRHVDPEPPKPSGLIGSAETWFSWKRRDDARIDAALKELSGRINTGDGR